MKNERGSALILALLMLGFLMILGSALLTSIALDVAIGENYRSDTQLLYIAEAGIQEARHVLTDSSSSPAALLTVAAGGDGILSSSRDLDTLLNATDDVPLLHGADRRTGKLMRDTAGGEAGRFFVFLCNDSADGKSSLADSNQILTLLSVAEIGNARKVLEVTVAKWKFPRLPAALVLAGTPNLFQPSSSPYGISGLDASAAGDDRHAIEVLTAADRSSLLDGIPDADESHYPGIGAFSPPPADIGVLAGAPAGTLDPRLTTTAGIERLVDSIHAHATEVFNPGWNGTEVLGSFGSSADYRVVVVNGDGVLNSGTGYGMLLVRGNLQLSGNFQWNGLILVIGQGSVAWSGSGHGVISGNMLVARTRADDRSAANELGTMLSARGPITVDFNGGSGGSIQIDHPGAGMMDRVNQNFPYLAIANREY